MKSLRRILRLSRLAFHVLNGVWLTGLCAGVLRLSSDGAFYRRLIAWWLGKIPRILGIEVSVFGQPSTQAVLMVANHISWLDIALLGGAAQPRFLSKAEVRHWPVIGWLAAKSGTLFITRGKAGAAAEAATTIAAALKAQRSVLLFPEGTTSTGDDVCTYHARLFAPALDANVPVQAVVLRYPRADGLTNPLVPYVDEQSLWANLQGLLDAQGIRAEIHFLPLIAPQNGERKRIANQCEQQTRAVIQAASLDKEM